MTYDSNNIFAKILRGELPCQKIAENDHALAFYDVNPKAPVHALVIPKGAYMSFSDFAQTASSTEQLALTSLVIEVTKQLNIATSGYRLISNSGHDSRQEVNHYHVHILGGVVLGDLPN